MARSGSPWSVKGIDEETRNIVRSRAAAADLTIGAWIDQTILNHAQLDSPPPPGGPSATTPAEPSVPAALAEATTRELIDLVDRELEASRQRLDEALRPVGFALRDLALRLVAAETLQRGGRVPEAATAQPGSGPAEGPHPESATRDPVPPLEALHPAIDPADLPPPPDRSGRSATDAGLGDASTRFDPVPEAPVAPGVPKETTARDPADDFAGDPTPTPRPEPVAPTGDLGPREFAGVAPPPERPADVVRFVGFQGGYESDPTQADEDARRARKHRAFRVAKIAAALLPILLLGTAAAGYVFADRIGLGPVRDHVRAQAVRHVGAVQRTATDAYHAVEVGARQTIARVMRLIDEPDILEDRSVASGAPVSSEADPRPPGLDTVVKAETRPEPGPRTQDVTEPRAAEGQRTSSRERGKTDRSGGSVASVSTPSRAQEDQTSTAPVADRVQTQTQIAARPPAPPKQVMPAAVPKSTASLAPPPAPPLSKGTTLPGAPPAGAGRIAWLEKQARAGDPSAQHELARHYIEGDGVDRDFAAAANWLREAAIQGVANAQYNLGVLYERGLGVTKDDVRALLWYHSAAEQSHPLAQYNLGNFYLQGRGIPLSYTEAAHWFKAASEQGVAKATYNLAVLTEDGLARKADKKRAMELYEKAAAEGDPSAAARLAVLRDSDSGKAKPATFAATAATQGEAATKGNTVSDIQAVLLADGLYTGRVDGIAGPKTRTAIRAYQREHNLPVTGIPSESLLEFMRRSGQGQS